MFEDNVIAAKSKAFAIRVAKLYRYLTSEKKEYVLSKQVLKSGTSIGANVYEAIRGMSKADFKSKMSIALKEANETQYWLEILYEAEYIDAVQYKSINDDCVELNKILVSIVKNS